MTIVTRTSTRRPLRTWNELFSDLWETMPATHPDYLAADGRRPVLQPPMDVIETETGMTIRLDLPGLTADDVDVQIDGDRLIIRGEFRQPEPREGDRYVLRERRTGTFKRTLRLNKLLDTEHVEATFHHGVLTLTLPLRPESQPKRIKVQTA